MTTEIRTEILKPAKEGVFLKWDFQAVVATQPVTSFIKEKPTEKLVIKKVRYNFSDSDDELKPLSPKQNKVDSDLKSLLMKIQPKSTL